jgi:AraC-like DNA-binding protein
VVNIAYPGDCVLYRPGEVQDYLLSKNAEPHTYWIHFNGEVCRKLFDALKLQGVYIIKAGQSREVEHLVSRICQYHNLKIPNHELLCSGLMQSVLALLSMVPNLSITVAECAAFCNMSKAHFARTFKRTAGQSPVQFILGIRIDRAKELLDFADKSIADIAEASGFPDQNYFTRTFKKVTGMTPTRYRNAGRSGT